MRKGTVKKEGRTAEHTQNAALSEKRNVRNEKFELTAQGTTALQTVRVEYAGDAIKLQETRQEKCCIVDTGCVSPTRP